MERGKLGSPRNPWFHPEWGFAETGAEPGYSASATFGAILGGLTIHLLMQDSIQADFEETEARGWNGV